jgi:inhibitor of growth protein 3
MDKHLRSIDIQIKLLYDRAEPGFTDPDEVPSLLRASAANHTAPSIRAINPSASITAAGPPATAVTTTHSNPATTRLPAHPHIRHAQAQQNGLQHAASAPATPAASMILNRQRESSAGPATKRGPRANAGPGNAPATSSGLARHSSLGPGTPKNATASGTGGVVRAGSAGPRSTSVKASSNAGSRRGTPTAMLRKKPPNKSSLSRVKKASARNSPASTADSDLSDAESLSGEEEDVGDGRSKGTPTADGKDAVGDEAVGDADDDEEDGGDDKT